MKKINYYFITALTFTVYQISSILSDIGEKRESYIIDYNMVFCALFMLCGMFSLGYLARIKDED